MYNNGLFPSRITIPLCTRVLNKFWLYWVRFSSFVLISQTAYFYHSPIQYYHAFKKKKDNNHRTRKINSPLMNCYKTSGAVEI